MPPSPLPLRLRRVVIGAAAIACISAAIGACGPSAVGPASSPSVVVSLAPTTTPTARPSPTPRPGAAAIAAFVKRVTSGTFSYRMTLKGSVAAAVDRGQVTGRLDTSGRDYALSLTFDFTEDYPGSALLKVGVREVDGKGFLREDGDKWRTVSDYVEADSAVPFASVRSEADVVYRETIEEGGHVRHRVAIASGVVIHPRVVPGQLTSERIRRTTIDLVIDDAGRPVSATWELDATGRVGEAGQLQQIAIELALSFSKLDEPVTIEHP